MTESEPILEALLDYLREAAAIACKRQANLDPSLKADQTFVTNVDLELSRLAIERLSRVVPRTQIISEEHLENLDAMDAAAHEISGPSPNEREAIIHAVVDPIDGTRNYLHGVPLYGVSVGILKDFEPWIGGIVFPELNELFYCDGSHVYLERGGLSVGTGEVSQDVPARHLSHPRGAPSRGREALTAPKAELSRNSIMLFSNSFTRRYAWDQSLCTWIVSACVTVNVCWPLVGRGIGTVLTDHLWDFAGGWPMLERLGFELRGVRTGRRVTRYDPADFDSSSRSLREPLVVSRPDHFAALSKSVTLP